MNFDYDATGYPGPYNVSDTARYWQRVDASNPDYLVVHAKILDPLNSHTQPNAALEGPVVFLSNRYRYFYVPDQSGGGVSGANIGWTGCRNPDWITAENTFPAQVLGQTVPNRYITVAWFYQNESLFSTYSAGPCSGNTYTTSISEDTAWNNVRLGPIPRLSLMANTPVEFWYLIFPHRYDDVISIPGQSPMTVKDAIAYLKAHHPQ